MVEKRETKQKREIENTVSKTSKLFTSEEIYSKVKDKGIGIATVYRFLNEMEKNRKIHAFVCNRRKLYSKNGISHSHFICEICGVKRHIEIDKIDFLKKYLTEDICHVQIELNGICSDCKTR